MTKRKKEEVVANTSPTLNMIETAQEMEYRCSRFPWFRGIGCGDTKRGRTVFVFALDAAEAKQQIMNLFPAGQEVNGCRVEFHESMGL